MAQIRIEIVDTGRASAVDEWLRSLKHGDFALIHLHQNKKLLGDHVSQLGQNIECKLLVQFFKKILWAQIKIEIVEVECFSGGDRLRRQADLDRNG